ncbi:MAG: GNAT family N-acetyltransferase [Solobacterium sp.]|nr:GNAT family N-acetyltransferase [Solobacterium sp.]
MIFELSETEKAESLFEGWKDTLICSCLQKVMGKVYVADPGSPVSAMAVGGLLRFLRECRTRSWSWGSRRDF